MIWYIWWLAALSFVGLLAVAIGHTFNYNRDFFIPADEVVATKRRRTRLLAREPDMTDVTAPDRRGEPRLHLADEHDHDTAAARCWASGST